MKGRSLSESLIPLCTKIGMIVPEIEVELTSAGKPIATVMGTSPEGITEGLFQISKILSTNNAPLNPQHANYFAGYHFPLSQEDAPLIAKTHLGDGDEGLAVAMMFLEGKI